VNVDPDLGMSAAIDSIVSIDLNADVGVNVGLDSWTRLWTSTIAAHDCHILPTQAGLTIWDGLIGLAWIQRILSGSDESCWAPAGLEILMGSDGFWWALLGSAGF
jgi:hypothetical protein